MAARLADPVTAAQEEASDATFAATVDRLSERSVEHHYDAFDDVAWEDEDMRIDPADPRWQLWSFDPLSTSEWYRSQTDETRAAMGLQRVAHSLTVGWQFENLLQRGLLAMSIQREVSASTFRYIQHEISEEAQHTMMFREFTHRSGLDLRGMPRSLVWLASRIIEPLARHFPELFFIMVLGGEDPADYLQRRQLKDAETMHPLIERIMRIHVTEESRHLSFARLTLRDQVPHLGRIRRQILVLAAPIILGLMARLMLYPGDEIVARFAIPQDVLRAAYGGEAGGRLLRESVAKPRQLCVRLGLVTPLSKQLWKQQRIWDEANAA
jgi:hypothetical protein